MRTNDRTVLTGRAWMGAVPVGSCGRPRSLRGAGLQPAWEKKAVYKPRRGAGTASLLHRLLWPGGVLPPATCRLSLRMSIDQVTNPVVRIQRKTAKAGEPPTNTDTGSGRGGLLALGYAFAVEADTQRRCERVYGQRWQVKSTLSRHKRPLGSLLRDRGFQQTRARSFLLRLFKSSSGGEKKKRAGRVFLRTLPARFWSFRKNSFLQ